MSAVGGGGAQRTRVLMGVVGFAAVARVTDISRRTIERGLAELDLEREQALESLPAGRYATALRTDRTIGHRDRFV